MLKFHPAGVPALAFNGGNIFFAAHLYPRQNADRIMLDRIKHDCKHVKGLAFIFLLRVFLRVTAQMNALPQIIQRGQMFTPL